MICYAPFSLLISNLRAVELRDSLFTPLSQVATMPQPHLSVLLPTYRQPEVLVRTLRDLNRQTYPSESWELVVLDDGSGDGSDIIALETLSNEVPVRLRRYPPETGGTNSHASLFNELIELSSSETELFVHVEDVRIQEDFLEQHAKWQTGSEEYLVTGPMCEGPHETFDPNTCGRWELMENIGTDCRSFACGFRSIWAKSMSYSTSLVERLTELGGGSPFDQEMQNWGYHETEFAYRASYHAEATCVYDVDCAVYHPAHNSRDEQLYRGFDREAELAQGEEQNVAYICEKHDLVDLPPWKSGEPIEQPDFQE